MQVRSLAFSFPGRLSQAIRSAFVLPLGVVAVFASVVGYGALILPGGWDGSGGLNVTLALMVVVWALGLATRAFEPQSRLAGGIETLCLFLMLSLLAAIAAAVLAIGGGEFIDPQLAAADALIAPFYDWRSVVLALPDYPVVYTLLSYTYASLNWQPFAFMAVVFLFGKLRDYDALISGWALGMAGCILPFHYLPALSPYVYYGITREEMEGAMVGLPWEFFQKFEGMRGGTIDSIGLHNVTGMVTIPSFHACAAIILAWCWWRFAYLRWPFLVLNIGMALTAVPIGGHYVVDVLAGVGVAMLAIAAVNFAQKRLSVDAASSLPEANGRRPSPVAA